MAASGRSDFCGIDNFRHLFFPLSRRQMVGIVSPSILCSLPEMNEARSELQSFLPSVRCSFFDQGCNLLRSGDVDRVAGAGDFDLVAVGSCGIPPFEIGIDGSVRSRYQRPAWPASPRSCGDDGFEIVSLVEHLRARHEGRLLGRQVGCEVLMKLRGVEVSETVCRLLYCSRLAEVTGEALSVVSLIFSSVGHVGRDVHQTSDG